MKHTNSKVIDVSELLPAMFPICTWNIEVGKGVPRRVQSGPLLVINGLITYNPYKWPNKNMGNWGLFHPYRWSYGSYGPLLITGTWRIIPVSKWLITMVIVSPLSTVVPLPNGRTSWLIIGGDPNHLQYLGWCSKHRWYNVDHCLPYTPGDTSITA